MLAKKEYSKKSSEIYMENVRENSDKKKTKRTRKNIIMLNLLTSINNFIMCPCH